MSARTLLLAAMLAVSATGCHGPDREPGDDPNRADEGPTAGRPASNPQETVDQSGPAGGQTSDMNEATEDSGGTLDGTSDEITQSEPAE
jgi:hypothetical protein